MLMITPKSLIPNELQQFGFDGVPLDFSAPRVWAALIVRPMLEQKAADRLKEYRLFAYWPCFQKQMNAGGGNRRMIFSPLLPGYIFIAAHAGTKCDPWNVIRQTPGIVGFLRDGFGGPAFLDNDDINVIRVIESGQNIPPPEKQTHRFKVGDKVRFIDDLLGRWPAGKVKALAANNRISVEVPLLGCFVPIEAAAHQIEAM